MTYYKIFSRTTGATKYYRSLNLLPLEVIQLMYTRPVDISVLPHEPENYQTLLHLSDFKFFGDLKHFIKTTASNTYLYNKMP